VRCVAANLSILVVGNLDCAEFRRARDSLGQLPDTVFCPTMESALDRLDAGDFAADWIVVARQSPAQFPAESLECLARRAPLARIITLLGSWCEGEVRTGHPWPGAIRIYWHQWFPRFHRERTHIARGSCSSWGLPITATDEERFLALASEPLPALQGDVGIASDSLAMWDWLAAACRRAGLSPQRLNANAVEAAASTDDDPLRSTRLRAIVFEAADDLAANRLAALRSLASRFPNAPIVALLGFPRIEDHDQAMAAGARSVVSLPTHVEDLLWELARLTSREGPKLSDSP
jgi:CheY-like chemotaxis protein